MTQTAAPAHTGRLRRAVPLVLFAGLLVTVAMVASEPGSSGLPLDPGSTAADGTRALVLILEEVGAEVTVADDPPSAGVDTLLVMVDNLDDATAARVRRHADGGGVVLVTGFAGALTPRLRPAGAISPVDPPLRAECRVGALRDAREVEVAPAPLFAVPADATGCYRRGRLAWLIARRVGDGTLITTASPDWLTNRRIGIADHAQLAVGLLAPRPGTRVAILRPDFSQTAGEDTGEGLWDLIPTWVKRAFAQLLVAFVFVVLWRARRLGKPVAEVHPVRLPASDLVIAVGNLLQRTRATERAGALLRADLRGALARRLGVPDADPSTLADTVAARGAVAPEEALDVIAGEPPTSEQQLLELARRVAELRRDALAPTGVRRDDNE